MSRWFDRFASWAAEATGSAYAFAAAVLVIVAWAVAGPMFGFSDTWQLVCNTGTTIVTFWLVFIIQNTQNRDQKEMKRELRELVRAVPGADDAVVEKDDPS